MAKPTDEPLMSQLAGAYRLAVTSQTVAEIKKFAGAVSIVLRSTARGGIDHMNEQSSRIIVRPLALENVETVVTMMKELAAFHDDEGAATAADILRFAFGKDRISKILVASLDGELCGFSASYDWMNYVQGFPVHHIDLFFVREGARGHGVGRALLKGIVVEAQFSACKRITVGAQPDNEGANTFYQKMGFELRRSASSRYALSGVALDRLTVA